MKCLKCQAEDPDEVKFNIECSSPMEFRRLNCGAFAPAIGKFCMKCAHELKSTAKLLLVNYDRPRIYSPIHTGEDLLKRAWRVSGLLLRTLEQIEGTRWLTHPENAVSLAFCL